MLLNLELWVVGVDKASNITKCLSVDDAPSMDSALRAITTNPPTRVLMLTGGRASAAIAAGDVINMIPAVPAQPPAPTPQHLGPDLIAIAKDDIAKLESDAKLCHDLCSVLTDFAKDGGALETLKQMASQLRQYQASHAQAQP